MVCVCVQRLSCFSSLLIPESPCNPLPFAVRERRSLSSALDRHGTDKLLYFVRQTLPTRLLVLLQSPDELVRETQKGRKKKKKQEKEVSVREGVVEVGGQQDVSNLDWGCVKLPQRMAEQRDERFAVPTWICWTTRCTLPAQHNHRTSDSSFLVSFSGKVMRFLNPNRKIAVALYHKCIHAIK